MTRKLTFAILPVLGALLLGSSTASAQQPFAPFPQNLPALKQKFFPGNHHYHVMYRQVCWKTKDFFCHQEAHQFEHYLESKGYQAFVQHHGNHYHVKYRFLQWKQYGTYGSHAQAHNVEHMLEHQGFEAKVVHH
jgi:hypothetical protein